MEARELVGGILVSYNNRVLELINMEWVYSLFLVGSKTMKTVVYVCSKRQTNKSKGERREFLGRVKCCKDLRDHPWCLGGDFNNVRFLEERGNCLRMTSYMRRF